MAGRYVDHARSCTKEHSFISIEVLIINYYRKHDCLLPREQRIVYTTPIKKAKRFTGLQKGYYSNLNNKLQLQKEGA